MHATTPQRPPNPLWLKAFAVLALIFGGMTLFSAGKVLFGSASTAAFAGDFIPVVVWFNFIAGFAYIAAGAAIFHGLKWALGLSVVIASATAIVAAIFAGIVAFGADFEMRTVGALIIRVGFWSVASLILYRVAK